jgi:hypothetical protein
MQLNGAGKSSIDGQNGADWKVHLPVSVRSAAIDEHIIDRAAEALFEFVFSGCDRLDGKHRWADCNEDTKTGFRSEAKAVLEAVWPMLLGQKPAQHVLRRA